MRVSQIPPIKPVPSNMAAQIRSSVPGESLREVQLADPIIGPILKAKEVDTPPSAELTTASNHHTRQLVQQWDHLSSRMEYCTGALNLAMAQSTVYR